MMKVGMRYTLGIEGMAPVQNKNVEFLVQKEFQDGDGG